MQNADAIIEHDLINYVDLRYNSDHLILVRKNLHSDYIFLVSEAMSLDS